MLDTITPTSQEESMHTPYSLRVVAVLFSALIGSVAWADTSVWMVVGRPVTVAVTHKSPSGDINVSLSLGVVLEDDHAVDDTDVAFGSFDHNVVSLGVYAPNRFPQQLASSITATCNLSSDSHCIGLRQVNSCTWNSLTEAARQALTFFLGNCTKTCFTAVGISFGESFTINSWGCTNPHAAQCVRLSGTLRPGVVIDLAEQDSYCWF